MKNIKILLIIFALSFVFNFFAVNALNSSKYNFKDFSIPAFKKTATVSNMSKRRDGYEILMVSSTTKNRNISYLIHDNNYADAAYTTLGVSPQKLYWALGAQNGIVTSMYQAIVFIGTKEMRLRTSSSHLNSTKFNGTWWLEINDWHEAEGYSAGDYGLTSTGLIVFG